MIRFYARQNKKGDGVRLSLLDYDKWSQSADCKTVQDIGDYIASALDRLGGTMDDTTLLCSSSLDWPRDHPDCTDECVALCNELTGNTVE